MKRQTSSVTTHGTTMGSTNRRRYQYWARLPRNEWISSDTISGTTSVTSRLQITTGPMFKSEARNTRFFRDGPRGAALSVDSAFPAAPTVASAQWVQLGGPDRPRRRWWAWDAALGIGVMHEFPQRRPLVCSSTVWRRDERFSLEALFRPRVVPPGRRTVLRHALQVIHAAP